MRHLTNPRRTIATLAYADANPRRVNVFKSLAGWAVYRGHRRLNREPLASHAEAMRYADREARR